MKAMTSHALARRLLAHRDNDVRVFMELDDDAQETGDPAKYDTAWVKVTGLQYDAENDVMTILTEAHSGPSWGES